MAYNSDGYIMIDFTEVDFRRTNQTIDGLYKRCVDVIGTNKFILVINANGRTPLPATCSFTNNQYVIDTCIYMFAISSNDNLFIRRNDVPASDIIDDTSISVDKTWSSNKIDTELDSKADTSALADYQPLLTPVSPISIDEHDNISVDLSGKQDTLTAGDNISIVNNVISSDQINDTTASTTKTYSSDKIDSLFGGLVKSFTYTGTGTTYNKITFPTKPKFILGISGITNPSVAHYILPFGYNQSFTYSQQCYSDYTSSGANRRVSIGYDSNEITLYNPSTTYVCNSLDITYTVYYI